MSDQVSPPSSPPPHWRPRFGMYQLFLITSIGSVMAAGGYYCVEALRDGNRNKLVVFVLFTIAAPMLVVLIVSVLVSASKPKAKRTVRKKRTDA